MKIYEINCRSESVFTQCQNIRIHHDFSTVFIAFQYMFQINSYGLIALLCFDSVVHVVIAVE